MKTEEIVTEFLALPEKERMEVLRGILPAFCSDMMRNEEKLQEMFLLFTGECGRPMRNMISAIGAMMGQRGCCG